MKTSSFYGFISALAGAFLVLLQYFAGLHSDPAKLPMANVIGGIGGLAIAVTCIVLGVRARRAEAGEAADFGYGAALGAGMGVVVVSTVLSSIFTYAYYAFINPAFSEVLLEDSLAKAQAKGVSGTQLDRIEAINRHIFSPVGATVLSLVLGVIFGLVICLIVAAFLKKAAPPKVAQV